MFKCEWETTLSYYVVNVDTIESNIISSVVSETGLKPFYSMFGIAYAAEISRHEVCSKPTYTPKFNNINL